MHGHGNKALEHFKQTCDEGAVPDDVTFVCILSACSHAGLVDEGMCLYGSMSETYMISAKVEHYACMVDFLGRAGHLQEAENMIKGMPCKPNADVWRALLIACRIHGNVEMGEHAAQQVLNWILKILQAMYCYRTCMLLMASGISVRMFNDRKEKKCAETASLHLD